MHPDLKEQTRRLRRERQRIVRRIRRAERRQYRRCFWSWPLGHEYVNTGTKADPYFECISCDKPRDEHQDDVAYLQG